MYILNVRARSNIFISVSRFVNSTLRRKHVKKVNVYTERKSSIKRSAKRVMGIIRRGGEMKTVDISGFGGAYEAACQEMLLNGMKYLNEHPNFDFRVYKSSPQVFGICIGEGETAEALDKAVCEGVEPSGAMHHAVISHLAYIHTHGYEGWLAQAEKQGATLYERQSEEEINKLILMAQVEWQLKLDGGYNPLAELFKNAPLEDAIVVNPKDPESIKKAAQEIASRMRKLNSS